MKIFKKDEDGSGDRVKIPQHVAIIMDGNGRWAKDKGLPRLKGHEQGAESVRAIVRACRDEGVKYLTLYAFSVENWVRPKLEIRGLMSLLLKFLNEEEHELHENKVRLRIIGRREDLPKDVHDGLVRVEKATEHYDDGHLILALSYGSRTEITQAVRQIAERVKTGDLDPSEIDEDTIRQNLYVPDLPDPDLLIRTSGEMRISNFLLWQISYSEIYITDVMWPDFRENELKIAIEEYGRRQRRFGDIE
ncbi:MAG: isoprenyl transferase [Kiritimatiellae bacterium]|nr:isoprenyl transferase [Kiritimatiellia bacterium]